MIKQTILYLAIDDQFTLGLNCTIQTLAVYEHNKMKAEVGLSPLQTIIMQLFLKQFPYFVLDKVLVEAVYGRQRVDNQLKKNVSRVPDNHLFVAVRPGVLFPGDSNGPRGYRSALWSEAHEKSETAEESRWDSHASPAHGSHAAKPDEHDSPDAPTSFTIPYQEILGHSSVIITQDLYGHIINGMQEEAMGKMNDLFREEKAN